MKKIPEYPEASALSSNAVLLASDTSSAVTLTATTISAQASDQSFNDSANGFGIFTNGTAVNVTGFSLAGNEIYHAAGTVVDAGKIIIAGADGAAIVDEAAGNSVTISKWVSERLTVNAALSARGPFPDTLTISAAADGTWSIPSNCTKFMLQVPDATGTASGAFTMHLRKASDGAGATVDSGLIEEVAGGSVATSQNPGATFGHTVNMGAAGWKVVVHELSCEMPRDPSTKTRLRSDIGVDSSADSNRKFSSIAVSAEDHDELYFVCSAGTMTMTAHITYWT